MVAGIMNSQSGSDERMMTDAASIGNIAIILLFVFSLIFDWYPFWIAFALSSVILIITSDVIGETRRKIHQKSKILESGGSLYRHCSSCGIRVSNEKIECPRCGNRFVG